VLSMTGGGWSASLASNNDERITKKKRIENHKSQREREREKREREEKTHAQAIRPFRRPPPAPPPLLRTERASTQRRYFAGSHTHRLCVSACVYIYVCVCVFLFCFVFCASVTVFGDSFPLPTRHPSLLSGPLQHPWPQQGSQNYPRVLLSLPQ
jgi:hypothetical protein